jgi:hypothetical protein
MRSYNTYIYIHIHITVFAKHNKQHLGDEKTQQHDARGVV